MNRVVQIAFTSIGVIIFFIALITYLVIANKQGEINENISKLQLDLVSTKDSYAKCYNSVNYGSKTLTDVSLSYLNFDTPDAQKQKLNDIETSFMNDIKTKCNNVISKYENDYSLLENIKDSNESQWYSFFIGGSYIDPVLNDLNPSLVRFKAGDPFTHTIFTEQEVRDYFNQRI